MSCAWHSLVIGGGPFIVLSFFSRGEVSYIPGLAGLSVQRHLFVDTWHSLSRERIFWLIIFDRSKTDFWWLRTKRKLSAIPLGGEDANKLV